jgi:hypothetical protein
LISDVYKFANMRDNDTLTKAFSNAKRAEKSVMGIKPRLEDYEGIRSDIFREDYRQDNTIFRNMQKEKGKEDIDDLVKQIEKNLEIKYLRRINNVNRNEDRKRRVRCYRCNKEGHYANECKEEIECYTCGKKGHISTNCSNGNKDEKRENNRKNNEKRKSRINNIEVIYDGDTTEDDVTEDESILENEMEKKVYETRSGKRYRRNETIEEDEEEEERLRSQQSTEKRRQQQIKGLEKGYLKRMKENKCNICRETGHFSTDCPQAYCHKCKQFGHLESSRRFHPESKQISKNKQEIGESTEKKYQLMKHMFKNLPRVISKDKVYNELQKYEKEKGTYFLGKKNNSGYIPTVCEVNVQGVEAEAVLDLGSAVTVITKGLLDKTSYEINEKSKARFSRFAEQNGGQASLGRVKDMEFFVGDLKTKFDVEVVDSPVETFLLGVDWVDKVDPSIEPKKGFMNVERKGKRYEIPIRYMEKENQEEYESDIEEEEIYNY